MKFKIQISLIFILLIMLAGCSPAKRDNPFDPRSGEYDEELVLIDLEGRTVRGWWGPMAVSMVNLKFIHQDGIHLYETRSDSNGDYSLKLYPGKYQVEVTRAGWMDETLDLTVNDPDYDDNYQYWDIPMYIWRDKFNSYSTGDLPVSPWSYSLTNLETGDTSYVQAEEIDNNMEMHLNVQKTSATTADTDTELILFTIPELSDLEPIVFFSTIVKFQDVEVNTVAYFEFIDYSHNQIIKIEFYPQSSELKYDCPYLTGSEHLAYLNETDIGASLIFIFELERITGADNNIYIRLVNLETEQGILFWDKFTISSSYVMQVMSCRFGIRLDADGYMHGNIFVREVAFF